MRLFGPQKLTTMRDDSPVIVSKPYSPENTSGLSVGDSERKSRENQVAPTWCDAELSVYLLHYTEGDYVVCRSAPNGKRACTREIELLQSFQEQSLSMFTVYKRIKLRIKYVNMINTSTSQHSPGPLHNHHSPSADTTCAHCGQPYYRVPGGESASALPAD